MKNRKKITLNLKKQTIITLDNNGLKEIIGGKELEAEFLSMFRCCTDNSRSCGTIINNPNNTIVNCMTKTIAGLD